MTTSTLKQKKCQPCEGMEKPLGTVEVKKLVQETPGWKADSESKSISREYIMKDFLAGVKAIEKITEIAQAEDHHPDLHLTGYRKLKVVLSTHKIGGLSENDFIVAAKINALEMDLKK